MSAVGKPHLVGLNHIALEVGDIEEALAFYGSIFAFELRGKGKGKGMAFIDMGDQFIALIEGRSQPADDEKAFWAGGGRSFACARACVRGGGETYRRRLP